MFQKALSLAIALGAITTPALAQTTTPAVPAATTPASAPATATAPSVPETPWRPAPRPGTALDNAKLLIRATDEEWKVIAPKLRKVMAARREAELALITTDETMGFFRGRGPALRIRGGDSFAGPGGVGAGQRPRGPDTPSPGDPPATPTSIPVTNPAPSPIPPDATSRPAPGAPGPFTTGPFGLGPNGPGPFGPGAGGPNPGGPGPGPMGRPPQPPVGGPIADPPFMASGGPVSLALIDLRSTLADPKSPPELIQEKLSVLRTARQKARQELTAAREDLLRLLTPDQEITLISLGYIE